MQLVSTPTLQVFEKIVSSARHDLICCAPYIGIEPCNTITKIADVGINIHVACDLRMETVLSGATRPEAVASLLESRDLAVATFAPGLHAKVYIADDSLALITSANMTVSGLCRNFEYGVLISDREQVQRVRAEITAFVRLGTIIRSPQLRWMTHARDRLVGARATQLQADRQRESGELDRLHIEFLRFRAGGRAPHAIFAEAILHCLASGPLDTESLHAQIQAIHPDFCDDSVDRVINGKHFGKKWKHAVRTAQQQLKRAGTIELIAGGWRLVEPTSQHDGEGVKRHD